MQEFGSQGWPGKHFQPGSSGRHSLRTGFPLGPHFFPFCFSLKPSNPGTSACTARLSPFAWRCVQDGWPLVQVGHLIAEGKPCSAFPLRRPTDHPTVRKGGFCGPQREERTFPLYSTVLYVHSWERRGGHRDELLWSDHPQPFLFSFW